MPLLAMSGSFMWVLGLNSGPYTYIASTLLNEPSCQLQIFPSVVCCLSGAERPNNQRTNHRQPVFLFFVSYSCCFLNEMVSCFSSQAHKLLPSEMNFSSRDHVSCLHWGGGSQRDHVSCLHLGGSCQSFLGELCFLGLCLMWLVTYLLSHPFSLCSALGYVCVVCMHSHVCGYTCVVGHTSSCICLL